MEKRIEDYLNLYLGCNIMVEQLKNNGNNTANKTVLAGPYKLVAVSISGNNRLIQLDGYTPVATDTIKPVLRPLSDMTEEEAIDFGWMRLFTLEHFIDKKLYKPESFAHLLARQFDLLNLIEEGLAMDATKMNIVKEDPEYSLPAPDPHPIAAGTPGL